MLLAKTPNLFKNIKSNKGVALLMALFMVMLIIYMVMQVTYESNVEYSINSQSINRLKAYYAAKSGVELSLLRIKLFQKATSEFGDQLGPQADMLNMIWSFPFAWPPVPLGDMNAMDRDAIKVIVKESMFEAQYLATIEDEGSKLDINDLGSPSKVLKEKTKQQLENIFKSRLQADDEWAKENRDLPYGEIINNLIDWIDPDTESLNGGDERSYYGKVLELDKESEPQLPPNRQFITLSEIRMVPGVTDEIWGILESRITIYGQKGINPNFATKEVLMSIDSTINDEIAQAIITRRDSPKEGGPFKDEAEFLAFLQQKGASIDGKNSTYVPLIFVPPFNFRVKASGQYANSAVQIEAVVADLSSTEKRLSGFLNDQEKEEQKDSGDVPDKSKETPDTGDGTAEGSDSTEKEKTAKPKLPKGRPRIIYWQEK